MSGTATAGKLEIEVSDFGPIAKATVDLRPLTVFAGPSNTGKTYLAILIYALHRYFGGVSGQHGRFFRRRFPVSLNDRDISPPPDKKVESLLRGFNTAISGLREGESSGVTLTPNIAQELKLGLEENANRRLANEIGRCFGISNLRELVRNGRARESHVCIRRYLKDSKVREQAMSIGSKTKLSASFPSGVCIPVSPDAADDEYGWHLSRELLMCQDVKEDVARKKFLAMEAMSYLRDLVMPALVGVLDLPAFYLPADRTGVMHAHSVVVSSLIAGAPTAGINPATNTPMLSGVLADFLEQLIDIGRSSYRPPTGDFGTQIETEVLGGAVQVERSLPANYPRFSYRPKGWQRDLALANASSMVSELAPVVLYLRHLVRSGNVLIVEEPEAHLHPAMQVLFTRQLAALVNAGVRVIVTTHSEWLLEELSNIVGRSQANATNREKDLDNKVSLRPDQVGAWLFEPKKKPKGAIVREVCLDESGMYSADYDRVAITLHNEWAELYAQD